MGESYTPPLQVTGYHSKKDDQHGMLCELYDTKWATTTDCVEPVPATAAMWIVRTFGFQEVFSGVHQDSDNVYQQHYVM